MEKIKVTIESEGKNTVVIDFTEEFIKRNNNSYIHDIGSAVSRAIGNMIDNNFPLGPKKG